MVAEGTWRPARAVIDPAAIARNVARLRQAVAPAALCAVVKANGYSHGALTAATAAIEAGAAGLAVALIDEGIELRDGGITAPILLLSEPVATSFDACFGYALTPTVATAAGVEAAIAASQAIGGRQRVHLKVDTGMHRVGAMPEEAPELAARIASCSTLVLEGIYTHFAVADGSSPEDVAFTALQLDRLHGVLEACSRQGITPAVVHAANTAGALRFPEARLDMVRCGIGIYGVSPMDRAEAGMARTLVESLEPALSLTAEVTAVHALRAGDRPSYGRRRPLPADGWVATVPLGYADGLPRRLLDAGFEVLIGGQRRPLAGTVTMDQIVVDCGQHPVEVGDEVVLLGRQGDECIDAYEWADRLGTIAYEVLCGLGPRVPRALR